jgi:tripartite-type tricarboxylate transporter receptor subunit TctC
MKLPRRTFLHLAAGAAALPAVPRFAWAQTYPSRPVRLVVGLAAGTALDTIARLIGQWLSERLGQPFIIENRPGAGGNIGTEVVVRAPPDGYPRRRSTRSSLISAFAVLVLVPATCFGAFQLVRSTDIPIRSSIAAASAGTASSISAVLARLSGAFDG